MFKGQSLAEYGIAAALIAIASIGAVTAVSGALGDLGQSTGDQMFNGGASQNFGSSPSMALTASSLTPGGINNVLPSPGADQQQVCLSNNYCLNIPASVPADVAAGLGNGTNQRIAARASILEQIAEQIDAEGGDSIVSHMLRDMANSGHGLAKEFAVIEDMANCHLGLPCSATDTNQSIGDWHDLVNTYGGMGDTLIGLGTVTHLQGVLATNGSLQAYLENHPGALDPTLNAIVQSEVLEIDAIHNAFEIPETPGTLGNSATNTHLSSNNICTVSGDSGCQVVVPGS